MSKLPLVTGESMCKMVGNWALSSDTRPGLTQCGNIPTEEASLSQFIPVRSWAGA